MALNDVNRNYTLGRGRLNFGQFKPGTQVPRGERYMGNSPEIAYSSSSETLDHYSSDGGVRVKDGSVILQQDYTGSFSLDDINMANLALFFLGDAQTLTVAASTVTGEVHTDVEVGFSYQLGTSVTNPSGVRDVTEITVARTGSGTTAPVAGVDYVVDPVLARITILEGGSIKNGDDLTVGYKVSAGTRDQVISKGKTIEGSLRYIANNPSGANIDYFMPYVKISPNGDFTLKGDDWQTVPFTIEILKKGDLEAIYMDGRPYTP